MTIPEVRKVLPQGPSPSTVLHHSERVRVYRVKPSQKHEGEARISTDDAPGGVERQTEMNEELLGIVDM